MRPNGGRAWLTGLSLLGLLTLFMSQHFSAQSPAPVLALDKFEEAEVRVIQPGETSPEARYLWNQYSSDQTEGPDPGIAAISPLGVSFDGTHSLKTSVTEGNLYLQFYPWDGSNWRNMSHYVNGTWKRNTYNRMRLWVRVPAQVTVEQGGQSTMYIGTYVRQSTEQHDVEAGGGHFYHAYNIGYAGGHWEQMILDPHPDTSRGDSGGLEQGVKLYPTNEPEYNYLDGMTRFYLDFVGKLTSAPADFYLDGVELYQETRDENLEQIYSLHGVYIPETNTVRVGWKRNKDENELRHEVRYSFTDIFSTGWDAATAAPNAWVTPPGWQGYNGMMWSSDALNVSGHSVVYIGIKPEGSNRFRQIAVPIPPAAPTGVKVTRKPS